MTKFRGNRKERKARREVLATLLIKRYGKEIFQSNNFNRTGIFVQHGTMSVKEHCINVAKISLYINDVFGFKCQRKDLIRGALLHDYFLYDWHDKEHVHLHKLHGFFHPTVALENATKEYELSLRERDIIGKHMWPLTVKVPLCREAWVVTTADKYCSLLETVGLHQGDLEKTRFRFLRQLKRT